METDDGLDLVAERARLAKQQADAIAMKNALTRGETVFVRDIIAPPGEELNRVRNRLLAMPSEQAALLHRCKTVPEVQARLDDLIHNILSQLSSPEDYANDAKRTAGQSAEGGDGGQEDGDDARGGISPRPSKRHSAASGGGRRRDSEDHRD